MAKTWTRLEFFFIWENIWSNKILFPQNSRPWDFLSVLLLPQLHLMFSQKIFQKALWTVHTCKIHKTKLRTYRKKTDQVGHLQTVTYINMLLKSWTELFPGFRKIDLDRQVDISPVFCMRPLKSICHVLFSRAQYGVKCEA